MMTLFKSHGLWDLVNNGPPNRDPNQQENQKKDARALFFIQQAVHDTIFLKIAAATNAKEAWTSLKTAFLGSTRVMAIKLQGLRRDFETLQMNKEESVQIFLSRVQEVVNQIRAFGDTMEEKTVVAKVLRSITPKFDHVVAAIEESNDLSTYSFDELMGSLQTHEAKFRSKEKGDERAFYRKGESSQGRGGRGHCRFGEFLFQHDIEDVKCFQQKIYGCVQADCFRKQREEQQACCEEE
ncbi:uncharacterized protein LOC144554817 [Carex rostrata]